MEVVSHKIKELMRTIDEKELSEFWGSDYFVVIGFVDFDIIMIHPESAFVFTERMCDKMSIELYKMFRRDGILTDKMGLAVYHATIYHTTFVSDHPRQIDTNAFDECVRLSLCIPKKGYLTVRFGRDKTHLATAFLEYPDQLIDMIKQADPAIKIIITEGANEMIVTVAT